AGESNPCPGVRGPGLSHAVHRRGHRGGDGQARPQATGERAQGEGGGRKTHVRAGGGVRGGAETEEYIDAITSRITLPGSIILGLIAILPALAATLGVNQAFAIFFGGTSLIIMVGVVLDTLQQIESYLLMKKYDGLVKEGRIEGRGGGSRMQSLGADF
ncbi:MAG: hypothetical protein AAGA62_05960, partial [Bacteroidota bacterium]